MVSACRVVSCERKRAAEVQTLLEQRRTERSVVGELGHLRSDEQEHEDREALQRRSGDVDLRTQRATRTHRWW